MEICDCYFQVPDSYSNNKWTARCYGTKERDICSCGGDKSKCNFYNLTKSTTNEETMDAITFLKEKKRMCDYESKEGRGCTHCPIFVNLIKELDSCADIGEKYTEEVVRLVQKWSHENPEYPTWSEWLHYIYNYYQGFNKDQSALIFMDWLNTRITQEEADHWNIPYRKDIIK